MPKGIPKSGINKGWFKNGTSFWTGKKRPDMVGNTFGRHETPWNKGFSYGKSNWFRKENPNEYKRIHYVIGRKFGKPDFCESCKNKNKSRYHWANISGKYTLERDDWIRLCVSCHYKFDGSQKYGASIYKR